MDQDTVLALFDRRLRLEARPDSDSSRIERAGAVIRQVGAPHDWNGVLWSDLDEAGADAVIAAQVGHFASLGLDFEWKTYTHDRPADLGERLLAAGFTPEDEEAVMVADVHELPTDAALPEGVRLRPVTDEAGLDLLIQAAEEAFGVPKLQLRRRLLDQLEQGSETVSMVVAMAGERPVCSARMEFVPGTEFAGLWGGGTVPEWRGRGIYRALVAHRARQAAELGYRYLQVDASDQSRPILQRLGFARLTSTTPYLWSAASA
ncbi:GNAT family N-acetyltransferase [Kitasatospora sp. NPDC051170]|uniref:GNAT family N-acetyltransferase n=1 Tax=Kitasatospora sp. NPDC051170 TaxID=3364056 RepID=UPI0037A8E9AE